jgi:hypothetical protein
VPGRGQVTDCPDEDKKDVTVELEMTYLVLHGTKKQGVKSIGDAPVVTLPEGEEDRAAHARMDEDDDGIDDNLQDSDKKPVSRPLGVFLHSVRDGEGRELVHTLFRQDAEWWLHYTFAQPVEQGKEYKVVVSYQLQRVLEGNMDKNTFRAPWLRQWHAPVKHLDVLFAFPRGFHVSYFEVDPRQQRGEFEGGSMGDLPRHTTVCCGEEVAGEEEMPRCTRSKEMALYWMRGDGECAGKQLVLSTRLHQDDMERALGGAGRDAGVEGFGPRYEVRFEPGLVLNERGNVNHSGAWLLTLAGFLVLFPFVATAIYTFAHYGPESFWYGRRKHGYQNDYPYEHRDSGL